MKKNIIISVILFNLSNLCSGQDIHFSQFYTSPVLFNPGATGNFFGSQRAVINYKDQWSSIANPYKTFALAFDMHLFEHKWTKGLLGVGITAINDVAGDTKMGTTQANFSVAYRAKLSGKHSLSTGLQGGIAQRKIDSGVFRWGNQDDGVNGFDPTLPSGETYTPENFTYGDFGAGMIWNYESAKTNSTSNDGFSANLGASVSHINQPKGAFYDGSEEKLFLKSVVHGSIFYGIKNTNIGIKPDFLYQKQGPLQEFIVGLMARYKIGEESKYTGFKKGTAISFGGYYRSNDAFVPAVFLEYAQFAIGFSYDVNVSGLTSASKGQGGVEISLRYINPNPFVKYKFTPLL